MKKERVAENGKKSARFQIREGPKFVERQTGIHKSERHWFRAVLVQRNDVIANGTELCWMVHRKRDFDKTLYGDKSAFVVKGSV